MTRHEAFHYKLIQMGHFLQTPQIINQNIYISLSNVML